MKNRANLNWGLIGAVALAVVLLLYWLVVTLDLSAYMGE